MTTKTEAENQIEVIFSTLKQAEKISFPRISLLTYGALIALIPAFEWALGFSPFHKTVLSHLFFYGLLFTAVRYFLIQKVGAWKDLPSHPIATRALLSQQKFAVLSGAAGSIALAHAGHPQFIFSIITFHIASLFYSFGKFSSKNLRRMAYLQAGIAVLAIEVFSTEMGIVAFPLFTTLLAMTFVGGAIFR